MKLQAINCVSTRPRMAFSPVCVGMYADLTDNMNAFILSWLLCPFSSWVV